MPDSTSTYLQRKPPPVFASQSASCSVQLILQAVLLLVFVLQSLDWLSQAFWKTTWLLCHQIYKKEQMSQSTSLRAKLCQGNRGDKVTPESAAQISAVTFSDLRTQLSLYTTKLSSASNPHRISHFDASRRDGTGNIERQRQHSHGTGPKVPIINCCCLYSRNKFQKFCR